MKCSAPGCDTKSFLSGGPAHAPVCRRHHDLSERVKNDPEFWREVSEELQAQSKAAYAAHGFAAFRAGFRAGG